MLAATVFELLTAGRSELGAADRQRMCSVRDNADLRHAISVALLRQRVRLDQRQPLDADPVSHSDGGLLEAAVSRKLRRVGRYPQRADVGRAPAGRARDGAPP